MWPFVRRSLLLEVRERAYQLNQQLNDVRRSEQSLRNELAGAQFALEGKQVERDALFIERDRLRDVLRVRESSIGELHVKFDGIIDAERARYDALLDKMLNMKLQGYAVLPKKIGPLVPEPEDRHMKKQGPDVVDPWIESIVAEGFTREEALAARKQVVADFNSGEG